MDDLIGEVFRSGSLPGLLMVLSADERSTLTATAIVEPLIGGLNSMGLEALFFIILMGCWLVLNEGCDGRVLAFVFLVVM